MDKCQQCGKEVKVQELTPHLVRTGYSLAHFPFISYKRYYVCPACLEKLEGKDRFDKVVAIIGLVVVLTFVVAGYVLLFLGAIGS